MGILSTVRPWLWRMGLDLVPFNSGEHPLARRQRLFETYGIDTVLDVGANTGQFALELRRHFGYRGRIVSFEPLASAFEALQRHAQGSTGWDVHNVALGDRSGSATMHVASNSESSSLLDMLNLHKQAAPHARYAGEQVVQVRTLDEMFPALVPDAGSRRIYLKIDTQGYEDQVLRGGREALRSIDTIQLEMSLAPLYEGQALFGQHHAQLTSQGYELVAIENNFGDAQTGRLLQIDGIYHRART